jgi:hypothetical protein
VIEVREALIDEGLFPSVGDIEKQEPKRRHRS